MKPTLVPRDGTVLDVLAERYRTAFDKTKAGRAQWIEGTLELAVVLAEAKQRLPDTSAYSRWIEHNGLQEISKTDRSALNNFAKDLSTARIILEQSRSISWQQIWRDRPQKGVPESRKGRIRDKHTASGSQKRKYIPTVMRDDLPPPPVRKQFLSDLLLTKEQVDPDFKGTDLEFATQYGHVLLNTKDKIEKTKRQETLQALIGAIAVHAKTAEPMMQALAAVDPTTLQEWMRKPGKAEKLRAWCDSIQVACEAIRKLKGTVS